MAQQFFFFMSREDEVELFRKLESWKLDLYPEFAEPNQPPETVTAALLPQLDGPSYYFAVGDVEAYPIKRGQMRGMWKIDEVKSPVVYFARSLLEQPEDAPAELRSGYFWCELEAAGDYSRAGGKPDSLRRLINELHSFMKTRYRTSNPKGFYIGPHAARAHHQEGLLLRESGRKGELVEPYR